MLVEWIHARLFGARSRFARWSTFSRASVRARARGRVARNYLKLMSRCKMTRYREWYPNLSVITRVSESSPGTVIYVWIWTSGLVSYETVTLLNKVALHCMVLIKADILTGLIVISCSSLHFHHIIALFLY